MDVFAGGGTLSAALGPSFHVVGGVELDPNFADEWQARHSDAMLAQLDARLLYLADLPPLEPPHLGLLQITGGNGRKVGSETVEFSASMRAT